MGGTSLPASGAAAQGPPEPPRAPERPFTIKAPHGHERVDPYFWLRERDNPEVLAHLRAENDYAAAVMAHTKDLQERLFQELRGRVKETDTSAPYRQGHYWYYARHLAGQEHPVYARKRGTLEAPEEILVDGNARAQGHPFYDVFWKVSSGEDILAVAEDTRGRNITTIRFRDLRSGQWLPDVIPAAAWSLEWAEDNRTLFYVTREADTLREYRVYRHMLGTDPASDVLVYEERDDTFYVSVDKTKSRKYLVIGAHATLSNEYRVAPANRPTAPFRRFAARKRGHEHTIDHLHDHFYIRSNDGAKNFKLLKARENATARKHWQEVVGHRADVFLEAFELFRDHLVLSERQAGLTQLRIRPWSGKPEHRIKFDEAAFVALPGKNRESDTRILRFDYESLTTPLSVYDYDMATRKRTLVKRQEVLGGYDPAAYQAERRLVRARDGTRVPVSLVYRRDLRGAEPRPLLLYGYGAYGVSSDPRFEIDRLSLVDRGFIYAIAHVRGGQELGRAWYEQGRLAHKRNSFHDFVDVAQDLVARRLTAPDRLFAEGGSAGGLLVGAVVTMRPELFHGAIADVPFVDVVTTMLDDSMPLTTFEYDEWGDPRRPADYRTMLAYSPYDNVAARRYPHLLVTAGLHDSQVQYWEPAKWVARLRAKQAPGSGRLLLKTNMEAGHGGAAGRYQRWREIAFQYAFLLDLAGLAGPRPAVTNP
ncbi:MAG: S9 family peptidase [Candidatus Sericytochromatia bacterium]|nr:S9 family peptidase [Candidatus Tanganyikabacteria bacterium]